MEVRTPEVEVTQLEMVEEEKVEVGWIRWLWIRWRRTWRGMKLLDVKVEAGWVGGEGGVVRKLSDILFRI